MIPASIPLGDGSPDGAAFGDFLRHARERRGLTLQQISQETKIPWRHLDALEHGRLNAVPGGPYRRGEIRAYAEVVGLDKAMALARLDRALESSAPPVVTQPASPPRSHQQTVLAVVAFAVVASAVLAQMWSRPAAVTPARVMTRPDPIAATATIDVSRAAGLVVPAQPQAPALAAIDNASEPVPLATETRTVPAASATAAATPSVDAAVTAANALPARSVATAPIDGLSVTSDPPGARVTVDGIAWGVTPLNIKHLEAGDRRVRVTKDGFAAAERVVRLSGDRPAGSLHIALQGARH